MKLINGGIGKFFAVAMLGVALCFAHAVQAKSVTSAPQFNHSKTGFVLKDVHDTLQCEQCHLAGIFKNTPKKCSGCHATGTRVSAKPKPINHVPTTDECDFCHTSSANFLVKSYNHAGVIGACATCHDGRYQGVVSKSPLAHIPTMRACETCHTNTITFAGSPMNHTGITSNCSTCHGGPAGERTYPNVVTYNPASHISLQTPPQDCSTCHTNFSSFLGARYDHYGVTPGTCGNCHMGQNPNVTSINTSTHIPLPAGTTCDTCHSTITFKGVWFHGIPPWNVSTAPMTCSTCHSGSYPAAIGKNPTHIPTTDDCISCHTQANTSSFTTFTGAAFSHNGLPPGTCGTCHSINSATHIPQSAGNACDTCHTNAITGLPGSATPTFLNVIFHQTTVGANPTGSCTTCHSGSYISVGALAKNLGHLATTADCGSCHTKANTANYTSFLGASFSHTPGTYAVFPTGTSATPRCDSCHNGSTATGKQPTHVTTTGDCIACHTNSTTGCPNCVTFYGVPYDHTNAAAGVAAYITFPVAGSTPNPRCDSCHGSTALGKSTGHISTTDDCMTCHTPASTGCGSSGLCSTFLNAIYSHGGIAAGTCGTCHQGQYGSVVSINASSHIPQSSGNACDACHTNAITGLPGSTNPTFLNVIFHANPLGDPPTGTCTRCHSGAYVSQNALGKNSGHLVTSEDCVVCHTAANTLGYTTFTGASFSHSATYPSFPTGAPASPRCDSCHGSTATGKNAGHISTTSDCISCHTSATTGCPNCSTFLGAAAGGPHTIASGAYNGTCVSCHNGSTAVGLSSNPNHIPINSIDCQQCHPAYDGVGSIDFSSAAVAGGGLVGTLTRYTMKHTGLTARCDSCHGVAPFTSQGTYGALGKVSNHIPTGITDPLDCTTCHTTFTPANINVVSGAADWRPETMNHNGAQGGPPYYCVTCHLTGTSYLGSMDKKRHEGASTSKDCSSSRCHAPIGSRGTAYTRWD